MRQISSLWDCKFMRRRGHRSAEPHAVSTCDRCALNPASICTPCFTAQMLVSPEVTSIQKDAAVRCPHCTSSACSNHTSRQELRPFFPDHAVPAGLVLQAIKSVGHSHVHRNYSSKPLLGWADVYLQQMACVTTGKVGCPCILRGVYFSPTR